MKNLGNFSQYTPENGVAGIVYFQNEDQEDWYGFNDEVGSSFVGVVEDKVVCVDADITTISPYDMTVVVIDDGEEVPSVGMTFDGTTFAEAEVTYGNLSPRQIRLVLQSYGYYSQVAAAIAAIEDTDLREQAEIEWEYADYYAYGNATLEAVRVGLGISEEDMNSMWKEAEGL